jgi:YggT family protein
MNGILFGLADVFEWLIWAYRWIVIAAVLITWVQPDPFNPIVRFLRTMTEPVFAWLRRRMPFLVVGGYDLSPVAVILILMFLNRALVFQLRVWGQP